MTTYTVKNDFHNTEITIRCEGLAHLYGETTIRPSKSQIKRMKRVLCGIKECTCSNDCGQRGPQHTEDGKRLVVDLSNLYAAS